MLREKAVRRKPVFRIAGFSHVYLICNLEFIESVLRRNIRGIGLKEVDIWKQSMDIWRIWDAGN